jgi:serine O-acetyltransferase
MLVIDLLVMLNGGFFSLKKKLNGTNIRFLRYIYLLIYKLYLKSNCCFIGFESYFKGPPLFPHGLNGVFISGHAKIGHNCVIFQNVTIGSNTLSDSKSVGAPIIGDNCYIGSGACIIGGIKLGNNCRIGANTTVVQDIPDNSLVISPKSLIIKKEQMRNVFYTQKKGKWVYYDDGIFFEENDNHIKRKLDQSFSR